MSRQKPGEISMTSESDEDVHQQCISGRPLASGAKGTGSDTATLVDVSANVRETTCQCTHEQGDSDCPLHVVCSECGADISHQTVVTERARLEDEVRLLRDLLNEHPQQAVHVLEAELVHVRQQVTDLTDQLHSAIEQGRVEAEEMERLRWRVAALDADNLAYAEERAPLVNENLRLREENARLKADYATCGADYAHEVEMRDALQAKLARVEALLKSWPDDEAIVGAYADLEDALKG